MPKSPYKKILIKSNNRDISDLVKTFRYEQTVDKDNVLTLTIPNATIEMIDDDDLQEGKIVIFQFGYIQLKDSKRYEGRISNINPTFAETITLTINITDFGPLLKKDEVDKVWQNKTISEIAEEIAEKHGLEADVEKTTKKYETMPQGGKTDFEFLKYLTSFQSDIPFQFYLEGQTLRFKKRNLKKQSIVTHTWNNGRGKVKRFSPSSMETKKEGGSKETEAVGIDPLTGEDISKKANANTVKNDEKLDDYVIHYNTNSEEVYKSSSAYQKKQKDNEQNGTGKKILSSSGDNEETENLANKAKKDSELNDNTAELLIEGDPAVEADEIITMSGVGEKYSGNWYIHTVTHEIGDNGYETTEKLKRNSSRKPNLEKEDAQKSSNDSLNKTPGEGSEVSDKRTVRRVNYDVNGNEV